jgi:RNA polymerase sigma-70 factor (ECF subfamily)
LTGEDEGGGLDPCTGRVTELFERHHEALWRFALRMTGDPADAEDLVQETFLRATAWRRRLPPLDRAARAWLMQTLVNLRRDRIRRGEVRRRHAVAASTATIGGDAADPESLATIRERLDAALDGLPVRRRAVLVLHELDGLDSDQVAAALGMRAATVRWHLAAARRHLRRALARGATDGGRE